MIVVDDHLLLRVILEPERVLSVNGAPVDTSQVATTTMWWWRLLSAIAGNRGGVLSRAVLEREESVRQAAVANLRSLPRLATILDLRTLLPAIAEAASAHGLNLLAAEALVVADVLHAPVMVGVPTPRLAAAALAIGVRYVEIT